MTIEQNIKDCIQEQLQKGIIEQVIEENFKKCIQTSIEEMFKWNSPIKKTIEEKIKETMIPYLEGYDYSQSIVKLDHVLTEVIKETTTENKQLLENFKDLMSVSDIKQVYTLTDIYKEYCNYCSEYVNKDNVNEDYDDGEKGWITCDLNAEEISNDWSRTKRYMVALTCEEDESLNIEFQISCYDPKDDDKYSLDYKTVKDINSLRYLKPFEVYLMRISQGVFNIEYDTNYISEDDIEVNLD